MKTLMLTVLGFAMLSGYALGYRVVDANYPTAIVDITRFDYLTQLDIAKER